jgi:hypothetical protein
MEAYSNETPEVISSMLTIVHEPNHYETCCKSRLEAAPGLLFEQ